MGINTSRRHLFMMARDGVGGVVTARLLSPFVGTALAAGFEDAYANSAGAPNSIGIGVDARVPTGMLANLLPQPLGVSTDQLRFTWIVPALGPMPHQSAYRIQVGRNSNEIKSGGNLVWDSGLVESSHSTGVAYGGPALQPNEVYYWRVRTWQRGGGNSKWSSPQRIVTEAGDQWTGKPIWAPKPETEDEYKITDGLVDTRVTIVDVAASIWFRAQDENSNYLWQLRAGSPAKIKKHVQQDGHYTVLANKPLQVSIAPGQLIHYQIRLDGAMFKTYIDGQLVDTTQDATFKSGLIGLRNGNSEAQRWHSVAVHRSDGSVVFNDTFDNGPGVFHAGTAEGGDLVLGHGEKTLATRKRSRDWMLARREFDVPEDIEAAWIYATAETPEPARQYVYRLWLNGAFVGVGPVRSMDPDNDARYQTHDITALLANGRNALAALCYTAKDHAFQAEIVIVRRDGKRQIIGSDEKWTTRLAGDWRPPSGFTGGGYYKAPQEYIDARAEPTGWKHPGFNDSKWSGAVTQSALPTLKPCWVENIALDVQNPVNSKKLGAGHWLLDTGKEIVGGLRLDINANSGQTVEVRLGEERAKDGGARYHLRASQTYREIWTLRDGQQQLEHWGYRAFRWIELITDPDLDVTSGIKLLVLRLPWAENQAEFSSSSQALDRVWDFCRYSIEATRLDVYQDTPTRERHPYEGDGIINQLSEYNVQRSYALARYSTSYLVRRPTWPTEYHMMTPIMAWRDYMATGDASNLADDYSLMVKRQLIDDINADGLVEKDPGHSSQYNGDLVDWPQSNRDGYVFARVDTVINAWQYAGLVALSNIARILGRADDQARFTRLAQGIKTALNTRLLASNGAYVDGGSTSHQAEHATAYPLAFGVTKKEDYARAADWLAQKGMKVSVYGAQALLDAIYRAGAGEAGLGLMTSQREFSWLHMMDDLDATITMEAWDPSIKPNTTFSHAWGTAPANIIPRHVVGVEPIEPGAARVRVAPQPAGLDWFKAKVPTIRGQVAVAFKRGGRQLLEVNLPPNVRGKLELDLTQMGNIDPKTLHVAARGYNPTVTRKDNYVTVEPVEPGQVVVTQGFS